MLARRRQGNSTTVDAALHQPHISRPTYELKLNVDPFKQLREGANDRTNTLKHMTCFTAM